MSFLYVLTGSVAVLLSGLLIRLIARRARVASIGSLSGPQPRSWLAGNYPDIMRPKNVGDAEFAWTNVFGNSVKIKGPFGSDVLLTADPKSLQWVLNARANDYIKLPHMRIASELFLGRGVHWADGDQHSRHRKILDPAFSSSSLKSFSPLFRNSAHKMVDMWTDMIMHGGRGSSVIDIYEWLNRATLDAIGTVAFEHDFGVLEDRTSKKAAGEYHNLAADVFYNRSDWTLALEELIPRWLLPVLQHIPNKRIERLTNYSREVRRIAESLVAQQLELHAAGKESEKDIMSILVKANLSEDAKSRLDEDEVLAQLTTLIFAGHETTASTLAWVLYELSRHPDVQHALQEEIKEKHAEGRDELGPTDFESMKYLTAVIKETLRYHPIAPLLQRVARRDDVIPLSTPHITRAGEMITSIPVSRGQRVLLSIASYNRLTSLWGEDADVWNPARFLERIEKQQQTGFGLFGNLATFSSGIRNCIGWRFAILEMQVMLVDILENFEFSPPPGHVEIVRAAADLMYPMVNGTKTGRTELPLTVTVVK